MRLEGSPTQAYHKEHFGADYDYYNFAPIFQSRDSEVARAGLGQSLSRRWRQVRGANTKHHDGFTLWPSSTPILPCPLTVSTRLAILSENSTAAVNQQGLRMGLYYSGGMTGHSFPDPIRVSADYQKVKPQSEAYGKYADAHVREIIARYKPAVLWNDI